MFSSAKSSNALKGTSYLLLHLKSPFLVDKKQDQFVFLCLGSRLDMAGEVHSFPESCGLWGPLCQNVCDQCDKNAMGQQDLRVKSVAILNSLLVKQI